MAGEVNNVTQLPVPAQPSRWQRFTAGALEVVKNPLFQLFGVPLICLGLGAVCHALPQGNAQAVCERAVGLAESGFKMLGGGSDGGGGGGALAVPASSRLDAGT
jgi:hypothetical protein